MKPRNNDPNRRDSMYHPESRLVGYMIVLLIFLATGAVFSEYPGSGMPQEEASLIKSKVKQVFVPVSVFGKDGQPVTGLTRNDFRIFEKGSEKEVINFFTGEVPVNLLFLVDTSSSSTAEMPGVKAAMRRLFREMTKDDRVSVVDFNFQVRAALPWTADPVLFEKSLDLLKTGGGTSWYDALNHVCKIVLPAAPGRKVVITLTDGCDVRSQSNFKSVLQMACSQNVQFFIVSKVKEIPAYAEYCRKEQNLIISDYEIRELVSKCTSELTQLAEKTGGQYVESFNLDELAGLYSRFLSQIRQEYCLSYMPAPAGPAPEFRTIEVKVKHPSVRLRYRQGYFNQ